MILLNQSREYEESLKNRLSELEEERIELKHLASLKDKQL